VDLEQNVLRQVDAKGYAEVVEVHRVHGRWHILFPAVRLADEEIACRVSVEEVV
jgi:hypothetical protein